MPVSVVVGGQYGSEGKGKVALELVRRDPTITIAVRPGGTNSGHTGYTRDGRRMVLRQLPAAAIDGKIKIVLPAGSYVDVSLLKSEVAELGIAPSQLVIDPRAHVIGREHVEWERQAALNQSIGSTGSGTGAAVLSRLGRMASGVPAAILASEVSELLPFIGETADHLASALHAGERILIEGTQGFGLSPLHGDAWPKATSRDTTASAFLSEAGISPIHVDDITLVIRSFPIRVSGDSGPLKDEISWEQIAAESGGPWGAGELTSVTGKVRRVGRFDAAVVNRAIAANCPTRIVLNHLDQVDYLVHGAATLTKKVENFIKEVEEKIGRSITDVGTSGLTMFSSPRHERVDV